MIRLVVVTCSVAVLYLMLMPTNQAAAQEQPEEREPSGRVVARVKLSSPNNEEKPVFAEAGDILTLISVKGKTALVASPENRRANVRVQDIVTLEKSKKLYNELIEEDPKNASLYVSRALVWDLEGEKKEVINDLTVAIRLGLKTPPTYVNRGAAYATSGEFDKAIADYDAAIELGYDDIAVFINRAVANFSKGDPKAAAEDFTRALKVDPKNEFALAQRGVAYQRSQEWDKAIADFSELYKRDNENIEAVSSRGFTHYLKGDSKKAVEDFTRAIKINPESPLAHNNRAFNRQILGQYKEAIEDYNKAIELAPKYALAHQNKAWLLATCPDDKIRDGKQAIESARTAGELREWKAITDIKSLAAAYAEVGDFDKAVEWQQKAVDMAEGDAKSGEEEMMKLYKAKAPFRFAAPAPK